MKVIRKDKWLLSILFMSLLPSHLFSQAASMPEEQPTEIQETQGDDDRKIKGIIYDEQGETIIGASVLIKGEETGTTSDMDGKFTLEAPQEATLVISYIGYHPQEIKVRKKTTLNIILKEDNQLLDEVVVVGYGTVKKSDLTGSVSGVSTRQFKNQPVKRVENILQGRTPGVEVTATSGVPGAGMKVRVRGTTSINKSSDPLYVIDGIISSSGLDGINPSDIQSMEVLKDASSTAIYGSRGSNGVILITTKGGTEGKASITFDASVGLSTVRKQYDLLNAYEYATALNDIRGSSTIPAGDLEAYKNGTKGINWTDLITHTGVTQDYRLSISGGNAKVKYLVSGNMLDQEAVTIETNYKRYGVRANIDADVKPWLTISAKMNASSLHKHNNGANWFHITNFSPTMEMKDAETGVYNRDPYNIANGSNPYGELMVNYSDSYSYNLNANLTLLFKIMKGLTLSVQGGYDYDHSPSYSFKSKQEAPGAINSMNNTSNTHNYWQNTNNLTWQRQFGDHSITTMAVWEISRSWDTGLQATGSNLNNESVGYWNIANAAIRNASNSYTEASLASGIIRANYDYKKRYFITAALRA
ncbi:SusC/RagA family TonB-linked outer membrane protein, partial [Bacteroides acidifaciens]